MVFRNKKTGDDFESLPLVDAQGEISPWQQRFRRMAWALGGLICALAVLWWFLPAPEPSSTSEAAAAAATAATSICSADRFHLRREWRQLSDPEKDKYIEAIQCLQSRPGLLTDGQHSRFEDFAYAHSRTGKPSHRSALFLAWHRLFVSAFDAALRSDCNYTAGIPYWDWTLDSANLALAPVWHSTHGFGGNGTVSRLPSGLAAIGNASCVTDGPFANLAVDYWSGRAKPHCLSRGFLPADNAKRIEAQNAIHPDAIADVLSKPNYDAFWDALEAGGHDALPHFIRGDFIFFTAPNDPVFFSHHAQLDRLWRLWQARDLPARLSDYNGPANASTDLPASLNDVIHLGGLVPDAPVSQIMDTRGGYLCYDYA